MSAARLNNSTTVQNKKRRIFRSWKSIRKAM